MNDRPDTDHTDDTNQDGTPRDPDATSEEYADLDPDTITEDAIEFFEQGDESPTSDAEAAPPG